MSKNHRWVPPDDHVIVLFGATGDLARRKLLPGLFHLHAAGLLPCAYRIIGSAPKSFAMTEEEFRAHARDVVTGSASPSRTIHPGRTLSNGCRSASPGRVTRPACRRRCSGRRRRSAALKPLDVRHAVRGQFAGYRSAPGVAPDSQTETMVAIKAEVDNWRWHGVPFFPRSGKAMGASRQVVTLGFRQPPLRMFPAAWRTRPAGRVNKIVINFADPGSITTEFLAKVPGPELALGHAKMRFTYEDSFCSEHALEGYEHLILLAMIGDQSLFTRSDGIERLWEISAPLLDNPPPAEPYEPGSWGPAAAWKLIAPYQWHLPEATKAATGYPAERSPHGSS